MGAVLQARPSDLAASSGARALVLGGGGAAGAAWMLGLIDGLARNGIALADADLIVGTSAGARVAAQLATGALDAAVALQRRARTPHVEVAVTLEEYAAAARRAAAGATDREEAARRVANLGPLGPAVVGAAQRRRSVAAQLPVHDWPRTRLALVAVAAESGRRVVFDAGSGVELVDAVSASGALPGVCAPIELAAGRFVDGAAHSTSNADLAAGYDVVVVVSPAPLHGAAATQLRAELATLGAVAVRVVVADDAALAAIGPNPMSARTRRAALAAGVRQAGAEAAALAPIWPPRRLTRSPA